MPQSLSASLWFSICVCLSLAFVCSTLSLSVFLSLSESVVSVFLSVFACLSVYLVCLCVCLSVCLSVSLSLCVSLSLSLCVSLSSPRRPTPSLCVHYLKTSVGVCVCAAVCLWVVPTAIAERNRRPTRSHTPRLPTYTANLNIIMTKACVPYVVPSKKQKNRSHEETRR